jgi:hypothetical protein
MEGEINSYPLPEEFKKQVDWILYELGKYNQKNFNYKTKAGQVIIKINI